jgi:hypothetical protein
MSVTAMLDAKAGTAFPRICSGACPFFSSIYAQGRKVAGTGSCLNHGSDMPTRVGDTCAWKLSRFHRRAPLHATAS